MTNRFKVTRAAVWVPGGDLNEQCAMTALDKIKEQLKWEHSRA
jgi:hypothetical protein